MNYHRRKWDWMDHLAKLILAIATLVIAWRQIQNSGEINQHNDEIKKNAVAIDVVGAAVGLPPLAAPPKDEQ